ncbi:MAG: bifunctional adenosylcobinamide kinase/adenosylcobinamide-phosphate guanylyltransferase [Curvibacter sp.]|nr:bifunctional adenosylcobinamide kinase/adenosylcobinamide-phosphate guanylyltransferase [Curvibacter sp.]
MSLPPTPLLTLARREFILGGQKSGKSLRAERLAQAWLAQTGREAVLIATAQAWDEEMQARIRRHQDDRARRLPGLRTVEEPRHLAQALRSHSQPQTLVLVDCLTLWLTGLLMPAEQAAVPSAIDCREAVDDLLAALSEACGPVVLVGNEIGLGVIPLGREVRAFVDALGRLNQQVAAACDRVTLMAAGLPLTLKPQGDPP